MNSTDSQIRDRQRLEPESWLVKTYMVEAHAGGDGAHDDVLCLLRAACGQDRTVFRAGAEVMETEEQLLFELVVNTRHGKVHIHVDASDPRFWLAHSMDRSAAVDWCIGRLKTSMPEIDTAWLPAGMLEWATGKGPFQGLGLHFDRGKPKNGSDEAAVTSLKMQLWGDRAMDVLRVLRAEGAFPHETTLSKVTVQHCAGSDDAEFSIDHIKYNGKTTARGTSFRAHLYLVNELYARYQSALHSIESSSRMGFGCREGRWRVEGSPVVLRFGKPVEDIGALCQRMFSCGPPFRLWGVPISLSQGYITVSAVDLHVGHPLDFEITSDFLRVYLHQESCGNTVARLLTNVQHTVDARAEAEIDGQPIPQLQPAHVEPCHRDVPG